LLNLPARIRLGADFDREGAKVDAKAIQSTIDTTPQAPRAEKAIP